MTENKFSFLEGPASSKKKPTKDMIKSLKLSDTLLKPGKVFEEIWSYDHDLRLLKPLRMHYSK